MCPETRAGASDRAGFIDAPQIGPANIASSPITEPTTIPAVIPFSRAPVETPRITNISIAVRRNSSTSDCHGEPAGRLAPEQRVLREQKAENSTGRERSGALACDIRNHVASREPSREPKADRNGRIDVGARNVSKRVNHGEHNQSERQSDANMSNRAATDFVDHDCARSSKDESECANEFCAEPLHVIDSAAQCSSQNESILA